MRIETQIVICPYCSKPAEFVNDSSIVYGRDYGPIYICSPCKAYVGCHKGTEIPLGRLANASLRKLKMQVHALFDPTWKRKIEEEIQKHGFPPKGVKQQARSAAYKTLAERLLISTEQCHIGMFDEQTCEKAIMLLRDGGM